MFTVETAHFCIPMRARGRRSNRTRHAPASQAAPSAPNGSRSGHATPRGTRHARIIQRGANYRPSSEAMSANSAYLDGLVARMARALAPNDRQISVELSATLAQGQPIRSEFNPEPRSPPAAAPFTSVPRT